MNETNRYYSREEWARAKFSEPSSPKYYESFLHHEGLKCVTDGQLYYLEPEGAVVVPPVQTPAPETPSPAVTASVAVTHVNATKIGEEKRSLPILGTGLEIRYVEISQRLIRNDPSYDPVVCFNERYIREDSRPLAYWQLFCEQDPSGQFLPPANIFAHRRFIYVWWNGMPSRTVHRNIDLSQEQREVAIPLRSLRSGWNGEHPSPPKERDLQLDLLAGLEHFHLRGLPQERFRLFEYPHTFLIIGSRVFFTTKLRVIPWHNFLQYKEDSDIDFDADIPEESVDETEELESGYDEAD
ncbi:MAG: hypothetical protein RBG13Loki_3802 [Promethearchaeota archaeon CR_4]|nr:MAG: hypothetical protein RBG13Loki_3802 [Candidatus Lokiarchaeota archaeon CR_4]